MTFYLSLLFNELLINSRNFDSLYVITFILSDSPSAYNI